LARGVKQSGSAQPTSKENEPMKTLGYVIVGLALAAGPLTAHADQPAPSGQASSLLEVKVPAAVVARANDPKPPANATKGTTIGKGKLAVDTSDGAGDQDSIWFEEIDIDGDGDVEKTALLWDDEVKVLYLYAEQDDLKCKGGGGATGDMLIAVNGKDNTKKRPAGSGFYVATLDASECNAKAAMAWGCRFDATGNPEVCSIAAIDAKTDELVTATASE
jgi:hypothetical protein